MCLVRIVPRSRVIVTLFVDGEVEAMAYYVFIGLRGLQRNYSAAYLSRLASLYTGWPHDIIMRPHCILCNACSVYSKSPHIIGIYPAAKLSRPMNVERLEISVVCLNAGLYISIS